MIVPNLCLGQSGYPKAIVYNGDTLVAITRAQLKRANLMKVEHDYYMEYSDSLKVVLYETQIALVDAQTLSRELEQQALINKGLNKQQKQFIKTLQRDLKMQGLQLSALQKLNQYLFGFSGVALIFLFILLL